MSYCFKITLPQHIIYHALQTHGPPIIRRVYFTDAIGLQLGNFMGQEHPTTAAEYLDMARAAFGKQVIHIFKVLYVAALVAGEGNALHIFLYGAVYHLVYTAVMAQVYHFGTT